MGGREVVEGEVCLSIPCQDNVCGNCDELSRCFAQKRINKNGKFFPRAFGENMHALLRAFSFFSVLHSVNDLTATMHNCCSLMYYV
jgi:hypothetical protein